MSTGSRLTNLDGLRGVAALIVVFHHYLLAFAPHLIPGQSDHPARIADTPIALFYNGQFAVAVFFVLSGFVVSNAAARSNAPLYADVLARIARLGIPAGLAVIWGWVWLSALPNEPLLLDAVLPHPWMHSTYAGNIPSFYHALRETIGPFLEGRSGFNNVLWTMKIELLGSVALYILYIAPLRRYRASMLITAGLVLIVSGMQLYYEGFVFGALLRERWASGRLPSIAPALLFTVGCFFGAQSFGYHDRLGLPPMPLALTLGAPDGIVYPLAAALVLYGVLMSPTLVRFFSSAVPVHLGRISFPLYLVHVPLVYTIATAAVLRMPVPIALGAALAFVPFVIMCERLAWAATRWGDEPLMRLLGRMKRYAPRHLVRAA